MERINPRSRTDQYGRRINREESLLLATFLPYASIMLCSVLPMFLISAGLPLLPPIGFLLLVGWRLMRPGLLPLWAGLPLGAFDDLFSGQPFGSAILLWSVAMIAIEVVENRFPWRGFWQDWFSAAIAVLSYIVLALLFSGAAFSLHLLAASLPQILLSIMLYPIIARMVAMLDRLRLMRIKVVG